MERGLRRMASRYCIEVHCAVLLPPSSVKVVRAVSVEGMCLQSQSCLISLMTGSVSVTCSEILPGIAHAGRACRMPPT